MSYSLKTAWTKIKTRNSAGFTLIELIVVMAVIAILVLLAAPRFMNRTQEARRTQIVNDVAVAERAMEEYLIRHNELPDSWTGVPSLQVPADEHRLYERDGLITTAPTGPFKQIPESEMPKTNLPGSYYVDGGGNVYYEDTKPGTPPSGGAETPVGGGGAVTIDPATTTFLTVDGRAWGDHAADEPTTPFLHTHRNEVSFFRAVDQTTVDTLNDFNVPLELRYQGDVNPEGDELYRYEIRNSTFAIDGLMLFKLDELNEFYIKVDFEDLPELYDMNLWRTDWIQYMDQKLILNYFDRNLNHLGTREVLYPTRSEGGYNTWDDPKLRIMYLDNDYYSVSLTYAYGNESSYIWEFPLMASYIEIPLQKPYTEDASNPLIPDATVPYRHSTETSQFTRNGMGVRLGARVDYSNDHTLTYHDATSGVKVIRIYMKDNSTYLDYRFDIGDGTAKTVHHQIFDHQGNILFDKMESNASYVLGGLLSVTSEDGGQYTLNVRDRFGSYPFANATIILPKK